MRPDAARNRARILEAARMQVAQRGPDVGIDEIAAAAGVAVGTVYRHFPTKADLLRAAVDASIVEMTMQTEAAHARVGAGASPGAEVEALFRSFAGKYATDRAVKEASAALGHPVASGDAHDADTPVGRAVEALQALLVAAQIEGTIRPDISLPDLAALLSGVPGLGADDASRERYVDIVLRGLRT